MDAWVHECMGVRRIVRKWLNDCYNFLISQCHPSRSEKIRYAFLSLQRSKTLVELIKLVINNSSVRSDTFVVVLTNG